MPRIYPAKTNFVNGELSSLMDGRSELQQYADGASYCRNVETLPQGGVRTRPGMRYIANVPEISPGVYSDVRLVDFRFSTEETYLFVFSHLTLQIYRNDVLVATKATVFTSDELKPKYDANGNIIHTGINWTSDLDTMLVFHEDHPIQFIQRQGDDSTWQVTDFEYINEQRYEYSDGIYGAEILGTPSAPLTGATNLINLSNGNLDEASPVSTTIPANTGSADDVSTRRALQVDYGSVIKISAIRIARLFVDVQTGSFECNLIYSVDGVLWRSFGEGFEPPADPDDASVITFVRDVEARYIALATPVIAGQRIYSCSELGVLSSDSGIDEVQALRFPKRWTGNDSFLLLLQDYESDTIRYSANAAEMVPRIEDALSNMEVFAEGDIEVTRAGLSTLTNAETFRVTFHNNAGNKPWGAMAINLISVDSTPVFSVSVETKGRRPGEPVWSDARGYPRCGLFFQERLWVAGSKSLPHFVWATRSQTIDDFNVDLPDDDFGIAEPADTSDVPAILNINDGRHLQFFTTSSEFYIPVSENAAVTPSNIVLRKTSSRGSQPGTRVFDVDGGTYFVQRRGKVINEILFTDREVAYEPRGLSLLASDVIRNPVSMALKKSTAKDDADFVYIVNTDGTCAVQCTLRAENVNGFSLWNTDGQFHDVAVVLDDPYFAVLREIDGVETMMIEVLDSSLITDSAIVQEVSTPTASISLTHLGSSEVVPVLDNSPQLITSAVSGVVTFERDAESLIEVGLKWPDVLPDLYPDLTWLVRTLPVEFQTASGAIMSKRRRISEVTIRLKDTTALTINDDVMTFRKFGVDVLDRVVPSFTGVERLRGMLGYDFEGFIVMGSDVPSKATILSLSYGVSV